ncbi:MAG TPA: hypothetical protein VH640_01220 [Bryobacteraceae bacterium]|jgi:hypothetical protein
MDSDISQTAALPSPVSSKPEQPPRIAGDILHGADDIAEFLFGDRRQRRRVYNLVEGNALPIFRMGMNICARKSVLLEWIAQQECASVTPLQRGPSD